MSTETEKIKYCTIMEPTFKSIIKLPKEDMQLRMFLALCNYAFNDIEPDFSSEFEEQMLAALWEQFLVVFTQQKKRARINSLNGKKGGRPKKASESECFSSVNQIKPTNTYTITDEETAAADFDFIQ